MGLPYSSFGGRAPFLSWTFSAAHTLTTPGTARLHWLSLLPGGHHASDPAPSETCRLAPTALLQTVPSYVLPASLQIPGTETLVAEDPSDWGGLGGGFRSSLSLGCFFQPSHSWHQTLRPHDSPDSTFTSSLEQAFDLLSLPFAAAP